jgi:hypothetical protein
MSRLKIFWCRLAHNDIAYGGGEVYWCRRCLSRFSVPWTAESQADAEARDAAAGRELAVRGPVAA